MAGEEFKVRVGVELDDASFNALKSQINGKTPIPVKVKLDTSDVDNDIKTLKNQIESLGKTNITLSGATKIESALDNIANSVKEMKTSLSSLNNVKIKPQMDVSDVKKAATEVKRQTESIATAATKTKRIISGVSTEAIKITGRNLTGINKKLGIDGLALNKRQISDITGHLKDMKVALDDITVGSGKNTIEITTHGFDEAGRKITKIMKAKAILDDDGRFVKWDWNVDTTKATKQIDTLGEAIKKSKSIIKDFNGNTIQTNVKVIEDSFKKLGESSNQSLKEMQAAFNNFTTEYSQWQASSTKNNPTEVKAMVNAYNELATAMTKAKNEEKLLRSNASLSKMTDDVSKEVADIDLAFKKAGANVSSLDTKFSKISGQSKEAEVAVEKLKSAYDELGASIKKNTTQVVEGDDTTREVHNLNEIVLALENYKKAYEEAIAAVKKNKAESDKVLSAEKYKNDKTNLINSIEKYKGDNSAALLKYGGQLDALIAKIKQLNGASLNGVKQEFKELQYEIEKDGLATQSFGDKLKTQFKRYAAYFSVASVAMEATQALRQMYQQVLDIDTAMTELKRVTDLSAQGYANLYDNMIASAKQYGATLSDIINSTADWSRAGFDSDTANELAGITMMYEHIADIDYEEATQNLLTSYKGFQNQLNEQFNGDASAAAMHITDVLNELDNTYAVTAAGIGEAMRRSAASMDVANNSMEQTAALITGAVEVTQDPEGAGNALKVVSMRLRGAKGELEDLGEEVDDNVENLTKMQGQILNLTHGHVNIFEDNGDFKSTYDILKGIYEVWDDLTDMEQADLLETVAGKHRANTVASILGNFEDVEKAYKSALNSTGSASRENEKYMNSLQGHLNQLTTAWQSFSNSFMSSGFLKGAISTASGFLNVIDTIVDKMGTIPTIISIIAAGLSGIKNIGFFKTVKDEATGFITKMEFSFAGLKGKISELKDLFSNSGKFNFDKDFTDSLESNSKFLSGYKDSKNKANYLEDATDAVRDYVKATDEASISVDDFRGRQMAVAAQVDGSARTFKGASNIISVFNSMTKETEKTQQGFVNAIANSNPKLASYLSSVKAGSASFPGYIRSLASATVKTVALTAVTTALNAALTMGISVLVSAAISAIDNWINRNEKLADSVQDVIDKYNEQKESLENAKSIKDEVVTSDGSKSRYEELSKGVDSLGKNVSLTADEYSEYLDITSRIASTFPELIQGYDSQGNAILSCKGNVEELTEAYNKLGHAANKEILNKDSIDDIQEDFKNDIEDLNDSGFWDNELTTDATKALEKMINSSDVESAVQKNVGGYYTQIATALHDAKIGDYESIDPYWSFSWQIKDYIADCIETDRAGVQKIVDAHNSELDDAASEMKTIAEATLSEAFDFSDSDYHGMSDSLKTITQQAVSGLDGEFYKKVVDGGGNVEDYIKSMVDALDELDNSGNSTVETAFDLQTKFNNGEVSYGEYADALAKAQNTIDHLEGVDGEIKAQLKLALDTKDAENQYETFVNRLTEAGWSEDAAKKFARSLSSSEMEVAFDLIAKGELKVENADELRKQLEEQAKLNEAMSFTIDMEAEIEGIKGFVEALTNANSAIGLTQESMMVLMSRYSELKGYDQAKLFEETATGIRLNATELNKLEEEYANSKIAEADSNLEILKNKYDKLGKEIQECSDINERAELYAQQEDIRAQINAIAEEATALEGLTNAYAQWQNVESAGNNRDMYANVQAAMEGIKEELDLGWVDDGTKEYFDLIWGDNWNSAGKGIEDYRAKWGTLDDTIAGTTYSIEDFFKVDKDGNLKASGINNFFDAVRQKQEELGKNWVEFDKDGNLTTIDLGVDGEQAIADALGISEELVDIFMQASKDAGFVVTIDGKYTKLADLQNRAEEAAQTLKDLGKTKFDFDFDTTSLKSVNEQLEEAESILDKFKKDGKIKKEFINADGSFTEDAQAAIDVMSTLTAMADQLSEPTYMKLETNQVEKELQEPLKDMQRFEDLVKKKHQLEITGADTSEVDKEMDEIAKRIEGDDDLRATLKIDSDASLEDIKKQLEAGELEIPATVDIQMEMSDDLKDIRMLLMHQAGMLSDEDLSLAFDLDLDTSEIDNYKPEQKKAVVDFFADTKDVDNYTPEQKKAIAKYIKDISDIDSYSPEDKQAVCDFIVNNEDVMGYTPDEKVAIAKYMADPSSLDSFTPEDKKAVAKFIAEHGEVDAWEPANRQAIATFLLNNALVEGYQPSDKDLKVIAQVDKSNVNNYQPADKTMTVWATIKKRASSLWDSITGGSIADGTANSNGTAYVNGTTGKAFKQGDWGTKTSGKALVGELGQELLVRDGHYYTIGDNGAEFIDYKKGDIIFNAGQTRQLFEQGKIVNGQTRGRAYVDGNVLNNPSLVNLLGITPFTGVFNPDVSPINEDAISTLEEYNTLLENAIELGYDLKAQTVFGNIDTNNRQLLTWTDENINMYHDTLKSLGYSDEDIVSMKGDVSTVMGMWSNFGENGEYEIAFSPMLQTDDGPVLLSADTVYDYINGLIAEASEDGVVTADELFELDARGEGNISNLLAAFGSSADVVSQLMHYVGKDGAIAMSINADGAEEAASDVNDLNNAVSETKNYTGEKFTVGVDDYGIQDAIEWMDELNGYIEESASSTGLVAESMEALTNRYKDLDGFDVASLFQESATGIQLNTDAVKKYEQQMAKDRSDKINKALKSLRREYYANAKAIKTCTDAENKQQLIDRNAAIREEIKSIDALSAAYDGATSKYNQWAEASSKSKQREPYDNINNEFDNVLDLLDRGWLGDEEVTSFLDLVYGDNYDAAGKTADEVAADLRNKMSQVIDGTSYSIGDFFTYDDNGKMTADGYFNMLDAIMQKQQELGENWVQMDENGNYTFDFGVNGLDEIAEAFGISKDLLALILQAGRDAGYEVNFGGVIENIDALEQKATGAVDKLHEIGATDYQFNLNTGDVDSLTEQLDVANGVLDQFRNEDGTINMDMDGAQEAIALVQYLQAQIDLVNSHYINIETDDESLQEPLEKLQDYEILAAELNSLNIDPQVNADEITSVEQQMQEIVDYIAGLDGETLAKLGLNFDGLTTEEIQQQITDAIKNGTVTIPIKPKVESTDEAGGSNTSEVNTTVNVNTVDPDGSLNFLKEYGEKGLELQARLTAEDADPEVINDCKWLVDAFGDAGLDLALALTDGTNGQNFGEIMGLVQTYGDKGLNLALALTDGTNGQHFDELMGLVNTYGDKGLDIALALTDGQNEQHYGEIMGLINTYGNAGLDVALALTDGVNEENYGKVMGLINDYGDRAFQFAIAITNDEEGTNTNLLDEIIQLSEEHGGEALDIGYALTDKTDAEQTEWLELIKSHPNDFEVTYRAIVEGDTVLLKKILGEDNSGTALEVSGDQKETVVQDGQKSVTAVGTSRVHPDNNGSYTYNPPDTYTGASLSGANGPSLFDISDSLFRVRQAQAQEAPQDNEGKVPVKGELEGIDASNVAEAEVPVEGELKDTDTTNAPEEQINVEGKMNEVDDSVLNNPFQVAVDDSGIKDALQDGETLRSMLLGLDDDTLMAFGNIAPGFQNALGSAQELRDVIANVPADGLQLSFSAVYDGLGDALSSAESFNAYLDTLTAEQRQVIIDLVMSNDSEEQTVNAEIQADDSDVVEKTSEQRIVPATIDLNTAVMESYLGATKHSTVALDPYLIKKSFTGTIALTATSVSGTGNVKVNGTSNANGTAYVNGTVGKAFKHGNWGTKESGTALVGELGQEMVVRDGHFFTVGDNGAEFFNYKKGDIVFNAGQTKQLFEQGKIINGQARGRAYANGTAFGVGTASGSGGRRPKTTTSGSRGNYTGSGGGSSSSSSSSSGGDSDASDEADEFEETLDWIETKIDRIERAISKLDTTASSVYKNWGTRNEALVNQISKVGEEINLQQKAYDRYMQQANSVGLSEDYASKVRDGTIDIETITDEDLNDKISDYKEW